MKWGLSVRPCTARRIAATALQAFVPAALMIATLSAGCGDSTADILIPKPDTTMGEGLSGASLYRFHCSACHGLEGRPLVASSSDLRDYDSAFATFDSVLSVGPGLMPMYPDLDANKRQLIYAHVRAFTR